MLLYKKMILERDRLTRELEQVNHQLCVLPEGTFFYVKQQNHTKWYVRTPRKQTYIQKSQRKRARQLALRKYLLRKRKDLEAKLAAVQAYLDHDTKPQADRLLEDAEYQKLILPEYLPLSQQLQQWTLAPYPQNLKYPEHKIHQVHPKLWVRSKSEALIATYLITYQIPFRYECALELTSATYYPDFTLRHPKTGETYYWEHLGLLSQAAYKNNAAVKIHNYIYDGILPGKQLIITTETNQQPLAPGTVEQMILTYFS